MDDPQLKKVKDHEFYTLIVLTLAKDFQKSPKPSHTTYLQAVHRKMVAALNTLHTLQIARILIAEQHPAVKGTKSHVKPADFLRYNVENYFLRITAYNDVVLQLINEVYEWGIKNDLSFYKKIKAKAKADQNKDVLLMISSLDNLMKSIKPKRNKIAHEGSLATDIIFLEAADYLAETIPNTNIDQADRDLFFAKIVYDNIKEMTQIEQDIATNLLAVMDLLWPVFKQTLNQK